MKLVLATRNKDKIKEIKDLLHDLDVDIITLDDFPDIGEVVEDGLTLEENSFKKADSIFKATHITAIADDTGLEVDYLNGQPGVYSSRFAGENATYEDNVNKLLKQMKGVPSADRTARFRCVITIVGNGIRKSVEGACEGIISEKKTGTGGFGYDPVFFVPDYGITFAEMPLKLKNKISHRGIALLKAKSIIEQITKK